MHHHHRGCLGGLLELFFLGAGHRWAQREFGFGRGGCSGCGCGFLLLLAFLFLLFSILFGTNWSHASLLTPVLMMV